LKGEKTATGGGPPSTRTWLYVTETEELIPMEWFTATVRCWLFQQAQTPPIIYLSYLLMEWRKRNLSNDDDSQSYVRATAYINDRDNNLAVISPSPFVCINCWFSSLRLSNIFLLLLLPSPHVEHDWLNVLTYERADRDLLKVVYCWSSSKGGVKEEEEWKDILTHTGVHTALLAAAVRFAPVNVVEEGRENEGKKQPLEHA